MRRNTYQAALSLDLKLVQDEREAPCTSHLCEVAMLIEYPLQGVRLT